MAAQDRLVRADHDTSVLVVVPLDRQQLPQLARVALCRRPASSRDRSTCSSASLIVPFKRAREPVVVVAGLIQPVRIGDQVSVIAHRSSR